MQLATIKDITSIGGIPDILRISTQHKRDILKEFGILIEDVKGGVETLVFSENAFEITEDNISDITEKSREYIRQENKNFLEEQILERKLTQEESEGYGVHSIITDDFQEILDDRQELLLFFKEYVQVHYSDLFTKKSDDTSLYDGEYLFGRNKVANNKRILDTLLQIFPEEQMNSLDLDSEFCKVLFGESYEIERKLQLIQELAKMLGYDMNNINLLGTVFFMKMLESSWDQIVSMTEILGKLIAIDDFSIEGILDINIKYLILYKIENIVAFIEYFQIKNITFLANEHIVDAIQIFENNNLEEIERLEEIFGRKMSLEELQKGQLSILEQTLGYYVDYYSDMSEEKEIAMLLSYFGVSQRSVFNEKNIEKMDLILQFYSEIPYLSIEEDDNLVQGFGYIKKVLGYEIRFKDFSDEQRIKLFAEIFKEFLEKKQNQEKKADDSKTIDGNQGSYFKFFKKNPLLGKRKKDKILYLQNEQLLTTLLDEFDLSFINLYGLDYEQIEENKNFIFFQKQENHIKSKIVNFVQFSRDNNINFQIQLEDINNNFINFIERNFLIGCDILYEGTVEVFDEQIDDYHYFEQGTIQNEIIQSTTVFENYERIFSYYNKDFTIKNFHSLAEKYKEEYGEEIFFHTTQKLCLMHIDAVFSFLEHYNISFSIENFLQILHHDFNIVKYILNYDEKKIQFFQKHFNITVQDLFQIGTENTGKTRINENRKIVVQILFDKRISVENVQIFIAKYFTDDGKNVSIEGIEKLYSDFSFDFSEHNEDLASNIQAKMKGDIGFNLNNEIYVFLQEKENIVEYLLEKELNKDTLFLDICRHYSQENIEQLKNNTISNQEKKANIHVINTHQKKLLEKNEVVRLYQKDMKKRSIILYFRNENMNDFEFCIISYILNQYIQYSHIFNDIKLVSGRGRKNPDVFHLLFPDIDQLNISATEFREMCGVFANTLCLTHGTAEGTQYYSSPVISPLIKSDPEKMEKKKKIPEGVKYQTINIVYRDNRSSTETFASIFKKTINAFQKLEKQMLGEVRESVV